MGDSVAPGGETDKVRICVVRLALGLRFLALLRSSAARAALDIRASTHRKPYTKAELNYWTNGPHGQSARCG